jgi:hypothetical protein
MSAEVLWAATIGDDGLEVALSRVEKGRLQLTITRYDMPTKRLNDATELRILGEAIRLAGLSQLEQDKKEPA